jgi:hypothetical protein
MRSQLDDMRMDLGRDLVWEEISEPSIRKSWEEQILANEIACLETPLKNSWAPRSVEEGMQPLCYNISFTSLWTMCDLCTVSLDVFPCLGLCWFSTFSTLVLSNNCI